MRARPILPALLLSACTLPAGAPDLSERDAARQPWPRLLPLEALLDAPQPRLPAEQVSADTARADRLRNRAANLSAPAISPEDRARIEDARSEAGTEAGTE